MKVIFLDIDGVLNTNSEIGKHGPNYVDPVKVDRIRQIISSTGASVVISSNWRYDMGSVYKVLDPIKESIIGRTGISSSRQEEINDWLEENQPDGWVAIDDLDLPFDNKMVLTDENVGITEADISKAIEILGGEKSLIETASYFANIYYKNSSL
jgi:hypothetical protein